MRLYNVSLEAELVVAAESEEDAIREVGRICDLDMPKPEVSSVAELSWLPPDWDDDAIPFGKRDESEPDRTIRQWAEKGAAPRLKLRAP